MNYTLFLYSDESAMAQVPPEGQRETMAAFQAYTAALKEAGIYVAADWLKSSGNATTITLRDGARRVQDGPYADTKEQLAGFYVINVADLDAALKWAEQCPAARFGLVEVRPAMF